MTNTTWGDTIRIKPTAPSMFRPGALGVVCGIRLIETNQQADEFGSDIGTNIFLVEFTDGLSVEIAERFVEKIID